MFDSSVHASFDLCTCNFLRQTVLIYYYIIKCTETWLLFTCPISFSERKIKSTKIDINSYLIFYQNLWKIFLSNKHDVIFRFFSLINAEFVYAVCFLWACTWICKRSIKYMYGPEKPILSLLAIFQQHMFV